MEVSWVWKYSTENSDLGGLLIYRPRTLEIAGSSGGYQWICLALGVHDKVKRYLGT